MGALKYRKKKQRKREIVLPHKCSSCSLFDQYIEGLQSSIVYAKHIQESVLPNREIFQTVFPKSFVIYMPRDIVSGDLYWFTIKKGKIIVALVDCTGHGVPGALLSMIANNLLNQVVNEQNLTYPSNILYELNKGLYKTFHHNTNGQHTYDGMAIAVSAFDMDMKIMEYSGAGMPLMQLKNNKIFRLAGDKYPIGRAMPMRHFDTQQVVLHSGDRLYFFTDGLPDQFGGPDDRKFMEWRFVDFIRAHNEMHMATQGAMLQQLIEQWKGERRQTDDLTVIGLEI